MDDVIISLLMFCVAAWMFGTWRWDMKKQAVDGAQKGALPGAFPCNLLIVIVAIGGALGLVSVETAGEKALGISEMQSNIVAIFLLNMLAAAIIEEIIFRGWLVVEGKGKLILWASIIGFSLLFAIGHPFLWTYEPPEGVPGWQFWQATFGMDLSEKAIFSTSIVFINSLWFYFMRFGPTKP